MYLKRPFGMFLAIFLFTTLACIGGLSGQQATQPPQQPAQPQGQVGAGQPAPATQAPAQPQPQPQINMGGSRPVRSVEEAAQATIKIVATGSWALPETQGQQILAEWGGSGFIIDPSGIAVTNNHVVTGAATLKVYLGGNVEQAYPARVVAASECMDLAVIQIEGGPFPYYFEWYTGPVQVGMEVYAAGFPILGGNDFQYTLTKGIISRVRDAGDTSWASMDYTLLHDARIRGGNSGGPLITPQGQVVGVNYAGSDVKDVNSAIPAELAIPVVEQLRQGKPYRWMGINGQAVAFADNQGTGIWVTSVESGSPADRAGLKPADIIISIENIPVAQDGTMKAYCDILASRQPNAPIKIQVLRLLTGEVLEGYLNGEPLKVIGGGQTAGGDQGGGQAGGGQPAGQGEYTLWTDGLEAITVAAPSSWTDVNGQPWDTDAGKAASLMIAPDLQAFDNFQGPGIWVIASEDFAKLVGHVQMLNFFKNNVYQKSCKYVGRDDYEDEAYRGKYDVWTRCGPTQQVEALVLSVRPKTASDLPEFLMVVIVHVTPNENAQELLSMVFNSFNVVGPLP